MSYAASLHFNPVTKSLFVGCLSDALFEPSSSNFVAVVFYAFGSPLLHKGGKPDCDSRSSRHAIKGYATADNRKAHGYFSDHITGVFIFSARLAHFCSDGWLVEILMLDQHGVHFRHN